MSPAEQDKVYGRTLVLEIERRAEERGVLGLLVGTSGCTGATPLNGIDLDQGPFEALEKLSGAENHPP